MTDTKSSRFRFFLPDARILDKDEIANLPPEKLAAVASGGLDGLWLEIVCPDESCTDSDGIITIPVKRLDETSGKLDDTSGKKGFFLNLFCPEDSCEIVQGTDLP
jgi:hypothetical protein